jgi:hypothetical protein
VPLGKEIQRRLYPLLGMCNTPFTEFPDAVQKQAIAKAWRFGHEKGFQWGIKLAGEWLMSICNDNGKNDRRPENAAKKKASIPVKRGRRPKTKSVKQPVGPVRMAKVPSTLISLFLAFR